MPATVLRVGIGSRGDVDLDGAVHLAESRRRRVLADQSQRHRRALCFGSLTCGAGSSKRERESEYREISYFMDFE